MEETLYISGLRWDKPSTNWCRISSAVVLLISVVPHKAVAEVSKIGNLQERLVVVNQGWQSEATDGPKGA